MDYGQRRRLSWLAIAILSIPALALFGYSLLHPAAPVKAGSAVVAYRTDKPATPDATRSPWVMQESGTTAGLRGIYSVDGKVAWASGTGGTVLKTVDGGEHWKKCAVPDATTDGATLDFRGVQAIDDVTAIMLSSGKGATSRLYQTTDGCLIWQLLASNKEKEGFWDAFVLDSGVIPAKRSTGLMIGDPINGRFPLWTINIRGAVGSVEPIRNAPRARKTEAAFAASNSCLFVDQGLYIVTGGEKGDRIIRSLSHGADEISWTTYPSSPIPIGNHTSSSGVFSLAFLEIPNKPPHEWERRLTRTGIAVGGDYTKPNESIGTAAWTADGGLRWTASTKPPHGYRSSVAWSDELKAWIAVGTNGSDISRDDGKTWEPLDDGNWNALSLPFVVGPNGRIARLSLVPKK
jgi:photosystem II stability/assembly factor-like uncharacterized protein